ncbi:hypothetical protein SAMN05421812_10555 [Asanoa hainanensis]|uniref:Uncharacterized protein n=1 Tax=Asanoa hainanensis TaxID=560556 RepID=A0A239M1X7_9ACTN|nr:hypothetical protein [Asanoa hainanensis]SNT36681.1 hypothetical protein SAMN05421812_10555 [Asanoa hainanensis]
MSNEPVVMQVYCRVEVLVRDPAAVAERAVRELTAADIDWSAEPDTLDEAVAELRTDLPRALGSLLDPDRMLVDVSGVEFRGGYLWVEPGAPSPRFLPGFADPEER